MVMEGTHDFNRKISCIKNHQIITILFTFIINLFCVNLAQPAERIFLSRLYCCGTAAIMAVSICDNVAISNPIFM